MISFSGCSNNASDSNKKLTAEEARVTECKFPSLIGANQDTKLCLVDLPGFGVYTADDEIMTR